MSISSPFIKRPVATSLLAAAFLMVGIVCYFQLPVSSLPQVDFPTLQVGASLPGASPETMASNVATPLERQLSLIAGVTQMTSSSTLGQSQVLLQFDLSRNLDGAAQDTQAAINAAAGQLPSTLPAPPTIRKVNPADAPILVLSMRSDTLPIAKVSDYADSIVAQQLSRLDGVGLVNIYGQRKPAIRIQIDPRKTAALGIQLDTVRTAIVNSTVNAPKGNLTGPKSNYTILANDQILSLGPWQNLIVAYKNGAPVRVKDIGVAIDDVENNQNGAQSFPGAGATKDNAIKAGPTILVAVTKEPGANVLRTVQAIKKALPGIEANVPASVEFQIAQDRTQTIQASVKDVEMTLLITIVLVVAVIFLFLRNVRATVIPSAVIPLSLLATAAVMLPAGFSLDNLSLMALTIAVGFVVDDAIVMVEAIWRRIEHGEKPFQAALNGSGEIGFTILSISISLIAVFTPLMFMSGVVGRLMREFALTLSAAVVISVCMSLTFTPMLCGKFLKHPDPPKNPIMKGLEAGFTRMERAYASSLDVIMRHKLITLLVFIGTAVLSAGLYATAHTGFFPQQDTGFIQGSVITAQDSSYDNTNDKVVQVMKIIAADPDVQETHFNVGGNLAQTSINVTLKPREDGRKTSAADIIARLRPKVSQVVGAQTVLQAQQDITIGARGGRALYQYTLSDSDLNELNDWAPKLLAALQGLPQLKDVNSDQQSGARAATLTIDRDAASRFGIAPSDIDAAIYNQVGQREVAQYFTQLNAYHVVLEGPSSLQQSPDLFNAIYLNSPLTGKPVPMSALVKVDTTKTTPVSVNHQGQLPAATISFNLDPGVSLGEATQLIEKAKADLGAPSTLTGAFQGTAQAFQESMSSMPILILAAVMSVYIILGVLYESYIHPLTILSTLPSAGVGALLFLRLGGHDLDVIGIIAIILLIGIVKKNGIMIVDVALKLEREEGMGPEEAVVAASHQRLRPILMTTACAFLGGVPMILGNGTGSEFRQPLGWAICGGLLVSQVLTLYSTPVIYFYLDKIRERFSRNDLRRGHGPGARAQAPAAAHELTPGE
ncbi:MAG: efflux RND transporter permease subunit [Caulobacteraceae bacterium]